MAYTIQYGAPAKVEAAWIKGQKRRSKRYIAFGLVIALILGIFLLGSREPVQTFLIPGDPEITKAAVMQFTQNIQQGDNFKEAITTFCREIIESAEIS